MEDKLKIARKHIINHLVDVDVFSSRENATGVLVEVGLLMLVLAQNDEKAALKTILLLRDNKLGILLNTYRSAGYDEKNNPGISESICDGIYSSKDDPDIKLFIKSMIS